MFSVGHAHAVFYDLLSSFNMLHDAHQLPGIVRDFLCERTDAVCHVQDGGSDLVGFGL